MVAAPLAGIGAFRLNPIPFRFTVAFRADVLLSKAHVKKMVQAGFISGEAFEEIPDTDALFTFHAPKTTKNFTVCQGDKPLKF